MVIAGGSPRILWSCAASSRFTGAGDGDRRRGSVGKARVKRVNPASTEPAMVIAGGLRPAYKEIETQIALQRSRRW